ncbi:MAG: hypothetical protein C0409_06250 [Novosphingobium sp.]|nr:hypothetical protein [Novosphingobium sp.]
MGMSAIQPDLQLHLYRSQCIDAFVTVETAVITICRKISPGADGKTLGQRAKRLREISASPAYSKAQRNQMHAALDELEELLPISNDIVHGVLTIVRLDQQHIAAFTNARDIISIAPSARLLTREQLQKVTQVTARLASRLDKILAKPASQT